MKKYNFTTITYVGNCQTIINHNLKTLRGVENRIFKGYIFTPLNTEKIEILDANDELVKVISIDEIFEYRYNSLKSSSCSVGTLNIDGTTCDVYVDVENFAHFKYDGKVNVLKVLYDKNVNRYFTLNGNKIYLENLKNN